MKTTFKVAIAALTLSAFVFDGCKKGPDDPFMSIHTRKARMTGDWKITQGNSTDVGFTGTSSWTYDGSTKTTTTGNTSASQAITMTISFVKDGSYTMVTTTTTTTPSANVETQTETGTWNFTGRIGDDKNKDHVVMRTLTATDANTNPVNSSTTTYTGDNAPAQVMFIDELKNKEIIFKWNGTGPATESSIGQYTLTR